MALDGRVLMAAKGGTGRKTPDAASVWNSEISLMSQVKSFQSFLCANKTLQERNLAMLSAIIVRNLKRTFNCCRRSWSWKGSDTAPDCAIDHSVKKLIDLNMRTVQRVSITLMRFYCERGLLCWLRANTNRQWPTHRLGNNCAGILVAHKLRVHDDTVGATLQIDERQVRKRPGLVSLIY